jgi:leucyl aminopeptidase (aminopeptidase T)
MSEIFQETKSLDPNLQKAAKIAVNEVLGTKKDEKILIVTNPVKDVQHISMALYDAAFEAGAKPTLVFQPSKTQFDFAEDSVINAIKSNPDICLSISSGKLGKDKYAMKEPYKVGEKEYNSTFTYFLNEKKFRSFWSPSVTEEMFSKTVPIDYPELRTLCSNVKKGLDNADEVHITSPSGTELTIGLRGREAKSDDGDFKEPGKGGNLPCGEVFISPELGTSNGVIGFDGSIALPGGEMIIKTPIKAMVKDGFVENVEGDAEAEKLKSTLEKALETTRDFTKEGKIPKEQEGTYLKNSRNLGELGIGLNKNARIVGNILEDEKVYGTCHIAIGANYDEDAKALIHLDGLIKKPTITLINRDGQKKVIMDDGEIV